MSPLVLYSMTLSAMMFFEISCLKYTVHNVLSGSSNKMDYIFNVFSVLWSVSPPPPLTTSDISLMSFNPYFLCGLKGWKMKGLCKCAHCAAICVMGCQISLQGPHLHFFAITVRLKMCVSFLWNCLAYENRYLETCHSDGLWTLWFGFLMTIGNDGILSLRFPWCII